MKYSFQKFIKTVITGVFIVLLNTLTVGQNIIESVNQGVQISSGQTLTYCLSDPIDHLIGIAPPNKIFSGIGIIDLGSGNATFDPSVAGVGSHTIFYNAKPYTFIVTNAGVATLAAFVPDEYCENDPAFALSGGAPADATGTYWVNGVASTQFDPANVNIGVNSILYSIGTGNCISYSNSQVITVYALTPTAINMPVTQACINASAFAISGGTPAGGSYDINGVAAVNIDPASLGAGTFVVTYTYVNTAGCSNSASQNFTVNPLPIVSFSGLVPSATGQCDVDPINNLVGNQAGGIFSGAGISNTGIGTATFNPLLSGLGYHLITYTYTNAKGCTNSTTQQTRVGTEIFINGLADDYCQSDALVSFNYTPYLPFHASTKIYTDGVAGSLIDNGNGDADFIPSLAGVSTNLITYEFWDEIGCKNVIDQTVVVHPTPNANFTGLNTALTYCSNATDVLLTGNFAPSETFTGSAGALTDHGNGTATFSPSALAVGGPYSISYSYTNSSGCSDTETKDITILQPPTGTLSGNAVICQGDATPLNLIFTGGSNYNFTYTNGLSSWNITNVTSPYVFNVTPSTSTTYTLSNVSYNASVPNSCTVTGTGSATIVVNPQVTITSQPADAEVCQGDNATFTVSATGMNLTYQWVFDDGINPAVNLGTSASQPVNGVTNANEGNYYCIVSSSCGGPLTSTNAFLTVLSNTTIITQPTSAIKCSNSSISFSIATTGSNVTYQWQKDGANLADIAGKISGSQTDNILILNLNATDDGSYTCIVNDDCGTETSNPAILTVNDPIVITNQPTNKTACVNNNIVFNILTTGSDLSYQWYFNDGINPVIALGTVSSQPVNMVSSANEGTYYCVVTSPCGASVTSNPVTFTLLLGTTITLQPTGSTICEGENFNLSTGATGSNLSYQWYKDGTALIDNLRISGSTTPIFR